MNATATATETQTKTSRSRKVETPKVEEERRCSGSVKWGIPSHMAPRSAFPKNIHVSDGLSKTCRECNAQYAVLKKQREAAAAGAAETPAELQPETPAEVPTVEVEPEPTAVVEALRETKTKPVRNARTRKAS
jgi:hypothetical protein